MIKIENTEVVGWEAAIRGMRNPMNSWEKSDTKYYDESPEYKYEDRPDIGPNDLDLMKRLRNAGTDHRKFMRMITVYTDILAPLYWWKEFDTYKVGTVANSCSTMHKIAAKEFTLEDFSIEHLMSFENSNYWEEDDDDACFIDKKIVSMRNSRITERWQVIVPTSLFENFIIPLLNVAREKFLETKDKRFWWQMIQLLPSSYNQKRTIMLNYEVLANMYKARKNHKLDEWRMFCEWIEGLPYSELITGVDLSKKVHGLGRELVRGLHEGVCMRAPSNYDLLGSKKEGEND